MLDPNLDHKRVDFGLSNYWAPGTALLTQCGSPAYTAPECLGGKKYGAEVDLWSIGINMCGRMWWLACLARITGGLIEEGGFYVFLPPLFCIFDLYLISRQVRHADGQAAL